MAVRIAKINPAAAFARIQLPILSAPRITTPRDSRFLHALEDSVELLVVDMKRIVVDFERLGVVEIQGKLVVNLNRSEMAHGSVVLEAENLREETGRSFLVPRRHNSMIQRYRHDSLPVAAHVYNNSIFAFSLCLLAKTILARMIQIGKSH